MQQVGPPKRDCGDEYKEIVVFLGSFVGRVIFGVGVSTLSHLLHLTTVCGELIGQANWGRLGTI